MNAAVLYAFCVILMLPLAGVTALTALKETMARYGFWATLGSIMDALFDPFGNGLKGACILLLLLCLVAIGFYTPTRAVGFSLLAVGGVIAGAFVFQCLPEMRQWGGALILSPSMAGIALSAYWATREFGL